MASARGRGLRPGGVVRAFGRLIALVCVGFGLGLLFGLVTEEPEMLAEHLRGGSESVELQASEGAESAPDLAGARAIGGWDAEDEAIAGDADSVSGHDAALNAAATSRLQMPANRVAANDTIVRDANLDPPRDAPVANERRRLPEDEALAESTRELPAVASPPFVPPAPASPQAFVGEAREIQAPRATDVSVASPMVRPEARLDVRRNEPAWSIQVGAFSEQSAAIELAAGLRDRYPVTVLPAVGSGGRWRVRVQPITDEETARQTAERLKRDERLPTWVTKVEGRPGS